MKMYSALIGFVVIISSTSPTNAALTRIDCIVIRVKDNDDSVDWERRFQLRRLRGADQPLAIIYWCLCFGERRVVFDRKKSADLVYLGWNDWWCFSNTREAPLPAKVGFNFYDHLLILIYSLCRNLPAAVREAQPDVSSQDGLEIKVCLRTYRLFYVSRTEDFMWRYRYKEEVDKNSQRLKLRNELRRKWLAAS